MQALRKIISRPTMHFVQIDPGSPEALGSLEGGGADRTCLAVVHDD